jgi:hypothetical protein
MDYVKQVAAAICSAQVAHSLFQFAVLDPSQIRAINAGGSLRPSVQLPEGRLEFRLLL